MTTNELTATLSPTFAAPRRPSILLAVASPSRERVFADVHLERFRSLGTLVEPAADAALFDDWFASALCDAEIVITSWRSPFLTSQHLDRAHRLKLVCHAAGTLKPILPEIFWERGIKASHASGPLAFGVAEYVVAMAVAAAKRLFWMAEEMRGQGWREALHRYGPPFELYGQSVGLVGCGHTGAAVARLLEPYGCRLRVWDPFKSDARIAALGATREPSLERLFETSRVVSLHLPHNAQTSGMIGSRLLGRLPRGAVFINTSRYGLLDEAEFIRSAQTGRFVACLDVFPEEPLAARHPLRQLKNLMLTPHVAGAIAENGKRIGAFVAEELARFCRGEALLGEVTPAMFEQMGD